MRYVEDWRVMSERQGFWIDMDDAYWTMSPEYVQSVWWALKRLHEQGLLFRTTRSRRTVRDAARACPMPKWQWAIDRPRTRASTSGSPS